MVNEVSLGDHGWWSCQGAPSGPVSQERLVMAGASADIGKKLTHTEQGCSAQNVPLCHFESAPIYVHQFM